MNTATKEEALAAIDEAATAVKRAREVCRLAGYGPAAPPLIVALGQIDRQRVRVEQATPEQLARHAAEAAAFEALSTRILDRVRAGTTSFWSIVQETITDWPRGETAPLAEDIRCAVHELEKRGTLRREVRTAGGHAETGIVHYELVEGA